MYFEFIVNMQIMQIIDNFKDDYHFAYEKWPSIDIMLRFMIKSSRKQMSDRVT